MDDSQTIDPRRRIRELMAIPERDRTDEQWDELNELEIRTAPGNRDTDRPFERHGEKRQNHGGQGRRPDRGQGQKQGQKNTNGQRPQDAKPAEGRPEGRPPKRQHRRPKRPQETPGNSN